MASFVEDYLEGRLEGRKLEEFQSHVGACRECYDLVVQMELQSRLLRELREVETVEPPPGFYGRVMRRIEKQEKVSFWSLLLDPVFGRRLAYASGALAILMATFLLATEPAQDELAQTPVYSLASAPDQYAAERDMQAERNNMLVQFVTYPQQ